MEFKTGLSALSSLVKNTSVAGVGQAGSMTDRLGSFADSLRGGLKSGKADADISLGSAFLDVMSGEMGKEMASLNDATQLVDALMGQSSGNGMGGDLLGGDLLSGMGGLAGMDGQNLFMELLKAQAKYTRTEETTALVDGHGAVKSGSGEPRSMAETLADAVRDTVSTRGSGAIRQMDQSTIRGMGLSDADGPEVTADAETGAARQADQLADHLLEADEEVAGSVAVAEPPSMPALRPMELAGHPTVNTEMTHSAARRAMAAKVYGAAGQRSALGRLLAARFESGNNPAAIGWDRTGGTSYGIYQIASRTGAFDEFLAFLDDRAPDMAQALRGAGKADTGSTSGAMPEAWKSLSAEHPERFKELQNQFIATNHFRPAADKVRELTGLDVRGLGTALSEVLFSTAVQHGATGSANIFAKAAKRAGSVGDKDFAKKWITEIYADRGKRFGSSSERVQSSVQSRLRREMREALSLLTASAGLDTRA